MQQGAGVTLTLLFAAVLANWPFVSDRLGLLGPRREPKPFAWRALEWLLLGGVVLGLGLAMEAGVGRVHPQGWAFYAVFFCLFAVLAFPGFVWRYLRRR